MPSPEGLGFDGSMLGAHTWTTAVGRQTSEPSSVVSGELSKKGINGLEHREDPETEWGVGVRGTECRAGPGGPEQRPACRVEGSGRGR